MEGAREVMIHEAMSLVARANDHTHVLMDQIDQMQALLSEELRKHQTTRAKLGCVAGELKVLKRRYRKVGFFVFDFVSFTNVFEFRLRRRRTVVFN